MTAPATAKAEAFMGSTARTHVPYPAAAPHTRGKHHEPRKSHRQSVFTSTHGKRGDVVMQNGLNVTMYHEGFFWRCSFGANMEAENLLWEVSFTNQPPSKLCMPAYIFPFPVSEQTHNSTQYDSAIIYRGFWSIFMLIGVAAVVVGGFIIICAAPFASHRLYKIGGSLFLASGFFLLCVVVMFVLWLEVLDVLSVYVDYQRTTLCPNFTLSTGYGLSFMFAPVGIFFCFLSGLLFLLIGRTIEQQY